MLETACILGLHALQAQQLKLQLGELDECGCVLRFEALRDFGCLRKQRLVNG